MGMLIIPMTKGPDLNLAFQQGTNNCYVLSAVLTRTPKYDLTWSKEKQFLGLILISKQFLTCSLKLRFITTILKSMCIIHVIGQYPVQRLEISVTLSLHLVHTAEIRSNLNNPD